MYSTGVQAYDFDYGYARADVPYNTARFVTRPVFIGDDVRIGSGCVICKESIIGDDSIVAAGSVITRDVSLDMSLLSGSGDHFYLGI